MCLPSVLHSPPLRNLAPCRHDVHMREFIVRNLLVGFSHIVIYDNNQIGAQQDFNITSLLQPFVEAGLVSARCEPLTNGKHLCQRNSPYPLARRSHMCPLSRIALQRAKFTWRMERRMATQTIASKPMRTTLTGG